MGTFLVPLLKGCGSLAATIACVTTYNRFLHLIGADDEGNVGGKAKGGLVFHSEIKMLL